MREREGGVFALYVVKMNRFNTLKIDKTHWQQKYYNFLALTDHAIAIAGMNTHDFVPVVSLMYAAKILLLFSCIYI